MTLPIPESVVPQGATGILVFAWAILRGVNPNPAYSHVAVAISEWETNGFSLLIAGNPTDAGVVCNSQAFWLPAPIDGKLVVTLNANDLPSPSNQGELEIHGFYPGSTTT